MGNFTTKNNRYLHALMIFWITAILGAFFMTSTAYAGGFSEETAENVNQGSSISINKVVSDGSTVYAGNPSIPLRDLKFDKAFYRLDNNYHPIKPTFRLAVDSQGNSYNQALPHEMEGAPYIWVVFPGDEITFKRTDSLYPEGEWWIGDGYSSTANRSSEIASSTNPASYRQNIASFVPDSHQTEGGFFESKNSVVKIKITEDVDRLKPGDAGYNANKHELPQHGRLLTIMHYEGLGNWGEPYYLLVLPETIKVEAYLYYGSILPDSLNDPNSIPDYGPGGDDAPFAEVSLNLKNLMRSDGYYSQFAYQPRTGVSKEHVYMNIDNRNPTVGYHADELGRPVVDLDANGNPLDSNGIAQKRKLAAMKGWEYAFNLADTNGNPLFISQEDKEKIIEAFPGAFFAFNLKIEQYTDAWHLDVMLKNEPPNYVLEIYDGNAGTKPGGVDSVTPLGVTTKKGEPGSLSNGFISSDLLGKAGSEDSSYIASLVEQSASPNQVNGHSYGYDFKCKPYDLSGSEGWIDVTYYRDSDLLNNSFNSFVYTASLRPQEVPFKVKGYVSPVDVWSSSNSVLDTEGIPFSGFHINATDADNRFLSYFCYPGKIFVNRLVLSMDESVRSIMPQLFVSNAITGTAGNINDVYEFEINSNGAAKDLSLPYVLRDKTTGQVSGLVKQLHFDANGIATIKLGHNEEVLINVRPGTYGIKEKAVEPGAGNVNMNTTIDDGTNVLIGTSTEVSLQSTVDDSDAIADCAHVNFINTIDAPMAGLPQLELRSYMVMGFLAFSIILILGTMRLRRHIRNEEYE